MTTTVPMTITTTVPLGADDLACLACGQVVPAPHTERVDFDGWHRATRDNPRPPAARTITLTRCDRCRKVHDRAATRLDAYPRVQAHMGSRSIGLHRVEAALNALDAIRRDLPIHTDGSLRLLIEHMTATGVAARWASRFSPVRTKDARDAEAASQPWGHLTDWQWTDLRKAFAGLLNARVERPLRYGPPIGGGCMLCGVGTISALPSQAAGLWTPATASPTAIGGRPTPERLASYLCPTCERAREEIGAIGPTTMERSIMLHLDVRRRSLTATELVGLVGWLASGVDEPNARAWQHVPNIESLANELSG
ncbi:hypothetical protein [Agromyces sp. ZXT2-6]|uniref:hypothetical protein n=1 Tax=Agromyces sp. ZXT2-6 TaxID=3461153 RepID=UPI0040552347